MLYAWDSVLYTRAIEHFDVTRGQPQPPGHIFYVGTVWLVHQFISDPNAALVWVSVFFAAAASAALYWLGRSVFGREVGLIAALLLATSLSFWAYSEVAYPYTLLAFLSIVTAGVIYRTWDGNQAYVLPAGLLLGIASGFRQDLLPFLFPLLLVGLYRKPAWRIAGALALLAAGVLAWYVPSALLSGGFTAYQQASSAQSDYLLRFSSVLGGGLGALGANLRALWTFLAWALAAALPLMAWFIAGLTRKRWRPVLHDRRFWFLAVWIVPSVLFYAFVHVGEFGYVFSFLPAALLASAWGLTWLADAATSRADARKRFLMLTAGLLTVCNLLLFLVFTPQFSANKLAARDEILRSRVDTIRAGFNPADTLIVAVFDDQQVRYYLPQYQSLSFDPTEENAVSIGLGPAIRHVVIFEGYLKPAGGGQEKDLPLAWDQVLRFMDRQPGQNSVMVDWKTRSVSLEGN